jgi:DNA-binding CsgD family transcriptional regulator
MVRHELGLAQRMETERPAEVRARMSVVAGELALADDDMDAARRIAEGLLAQHGVPAPLRCHAYEIVGRSRRLRDLIGAEAAFEAALATADAAGLPVWRLRALHELGTIDMFDHVGVERLAEARRVSEVMGALVTVATLDLQLSACYTSRWDLDSCDAHADSAIELATRLGLGQVRAKAFAMRAGSASMRADSDATDRYARFAVAAAPGDDMLEGFCLACRGMTWVMRGEPTRGLALYSEGMTVLGRLPNAEPAANRALWPLVLASLGDGRAAGAVEEARRLGVDAFKLNRGLLGYAEAVLAGRGAGPHRADTLTATADAAFVNCGTWAALARYLVAPCARADGWGRPQAWLGEAVDAFSGQGLDALAARADGLRRAGDANPWAGEGITNREADVLRLIGQGLANKEIAASLRVSPRTVEKHVESLLRKTGARTRVDLALRSRAT